MFDIGWIELLLVAIVAIVVVGPRDLPRLMYKVGQWVTKARKMASHFQSGIEEMARQAELDDLRKEAKAIKRDLTMLDPTRPPVPTAPPAAPSIKVPATQTIGLPETAPIVDAAVSTVPEPTHGVAP